MTDPFTDLAWPSEHLAEAVELLAHKVGYIPHVEPRRLEIPVDLALADLPTLRHWMDKLGRTLKVEIEPVHTAYADLRATLRSAVPYILRLPPPGPNEKAIFLAVLRSSRTQCCILDRQGKGHWLSTASLLQSLCDPLEAPHLPSLNAAVEALNLSPDRQAHARRTLLGERLHTMPVEGIWLVKLALDSPFWKRLRYDRILPAFGNLLLTYLVVQALFLVSWWILGISALQGTFEWSWLAAWALLQFSAVPFYLAWFYAQDIFSIRVGIFFKQRLLLGTLKSDPDEIRHMGSGQTVSHVTTLEFGEAKAVDDALAVFTSVVDIVAAIVVLAAGIGGPLHALLLFVWAVLAFLVATKYFQINQPWHKQYRHMSNQVIEKMLAQQTRLAQEDRAHWHDEEDIEMVKYIQLSKQRSVIESLLFTFGTGWMLIGLLALAPAIAGMVPAQTSRLAVSVGGIILAYQGFKALAEGLDNAVVSATALIQAKMLFNSANRKKLEPMVMVKDDHIAPQEGPLNQTPMLMARELVYRYRPGSRVILKGCNLRIQRGDRILLEGPSGGGKSTLAGVLGGMRTPENGLLLLWDFDKKTLGEEIWRQRVIVTPQFHENHIFSGSLAFNLLMGRRWPAHPADLVEAEGICHELGLGDLLRRMPAGLQQVVGERGWRLSHGEKSRIYMARALLQKADLVILDESFGSLDPENLFQAMNCAIARAQTLFVIAHP